MTGWIQKSKQYKWADEAGNPNDGAEEQLAEGTQETPRAEEPEVQVLSDGIGNPSC